jgi:hypothetical protein
MNVIKGLVDLQLLQEEKELPRSFLDYLREEWMELYKLYSDGESLEEFSLEPHGIQIVLEKGDNLPDEIGVIVFPEYVERISFNNMDIYRMYVMEAEDYGRLYYSIVGTLNDESEAFLQEHTEMNER